VQESCGLRERASKLQENVTARTAASPILREIEADIAQRVSLQKDQAQENIGFSMERDKQRLRANIFRNMLPALLQRDKTAIESLQNKWNTLGLG